jgi:pimeloyl-ACP methyl ester carboxylesterase
MSLRENTVKDWLPCYTGLDSMKFRFLVPVLLILVVPGLYAGGEPKLIQAYPAKGFSYPYVLVVPDSVEKGKPVPLVLETNNTGPSDDFETTQARTLEHAAGNGLGPMLSRYKGHPLVMPVFPRPETDWRIYTHALDRDTLLIQDGPLARLDLQVLAMVEDARRHLSKEGYSVPPEFIMIGFSASGTFANRFAFLHPDRLSAVVSGGVNCFPMLPVAEVEDKPFNFPLGVADLEDLTGQAFNTEAWKALPQMIFMGALDDNDAVKFDDAYSDEERSLIFEHVGEPMHERWMKAQQLCLELEPRITFITYGQVGHWTNRQIGLDIVTFIEEALRAGQRQR